VIGAQISGATNGLKVVQGELVETAGAADKLDIALRETSAAFDNIGNVAMKTAKSFDEVSAEVFATADAFNNKWNPVIKQATAETNKFAATVASFGGGVAKFTPNFKAFGAEVPKLGANLPAAGAAVKKMGTDFTGLSRVIQDLPFGFTAIQNNITQLVPAAGALGLVISAVTAAITFAQIGFSAWTRGLHGAAEGAKATGDVLNEAFGSAAGKIAQVKALSEVLTDQGETLQRRKIALQELTRIDKEHFGQLKLGKSSYEDIKKAVDDYSNSLFAQAKIQGAVSALAEAETNRLKALTVFTKAANIANLEAAKIISGELVIARGQQTTAQREAFKAAQELQVVTQVQIDLEKQVNDETKKGLDFTEEKIEKIKKVKVEVDKTKEAFDRLIATEIQFIDFLTNLEKVPLGIGNNFKKMFLDIKAGQDKLKGSTGILPESFFEDTDKRAADSRKKTADQLAFAMEAAKQLQGVFTEVFTGLAQTGQLSIQSLIKSLEQLIIKLASAALAAAVISVALGGSFGAIFGGLTGLKGIIPHMATGGIVTGPTMALMGEKGPEVVLPLDRLREFMTGGSSQVVVLETRVRGDDLYLINSRTAARRGRAY